MLLNKQNPFSWNFICMLLTTFFSLVESEKGSDLQMRMVACESRKKKHWSGGRLSFISSVRNCFISAVWPIARRNDVASARGMESCLAGTTLISAMSCWKLTKKCGFPLQLVQCSGCRKAVAVRRFWQLGQADKYNLLLTSGWTVLKYGDFKGHKGDWWIRFHHQAMLRPSRITQW